MKNLETLAELAKSLPADVAEKAAALITSMGEIIEGIGDKPIEWRPETLKLVQATSDRSKLPKGATIGSLVLGEDVLEQPVKVIPIRLWTSRQYWNPDPEKASMLCSSPDGIVGYQYGDCKLCPYQKFDTENNKSQCNKTMTYMAITSTLDRIFFINFSKTNYAQGTDWQSQITKTRAVPYKRIYNLTTQTSAKSKNVEVIRAEPILDGKVEGSVLAFVEELFRVSSADRKEHLEKFHELVAQRKSAAAQLGLSDAHTMELLPAASDDTVVEVTTVAEQAAAAEATPKSGKKYQV